MGHTNHQGHHDSHSYEGAHEESTQTNLTQSEPLCLLQALEAMLSLYSLGTAGHL